MRRSTAEAAPVRLTAKPRVCFVVESGTDVRLVEGLGRHFQITVFARRIEGGREISQRPKASVRLLRAVPSRLRFAGAVFKFLRRHRLKFDFIIVQGYGLAAAAANFARFLSRTPTAMLVCSPTEVYYKLRQRYPETGKFYRAHEMWAVKLLALINAVIGNHYIVLSHYLARVVKGHGFRGRIDVVPVYGVDTIRFHPSAEPRETVKARLGLPATGSLIFFSSRIAPEKDSEALLAAIQTLRHDGRDIWLLHRSGGFRQFRKKAEAFGIGDRVIATNAVHPYHDLPQDYQAADVCVQASRAEGLGFSPLEALACGAAVVVSATGGLTETIDDGKTGWTYPVGDVARLARCLQEALDHPEEAARRAQAGRNMVRSRFEERSAFEQLSEVVCTAVGR